MNTPALLRAVMRRSWWSYQRVRGRVHAAVDQRRPAPTGYRAVHAEGVRHVARVVDRFDAAEVASETLELVRNALDDTGADYVVLPRLAEGMAMVAVDSDCLDEACAALRTLASGPEWAIVVGHGWRVRVQSLRRWVRSAQTPAPSAVVFRALAADTGLLLGTAAQGVRIEVWDTVHDATVPRVDGETYEPGTRIAPRANTSYAYLTPRSWGAAHGVEPEAPLSSPHLFDVTDPIDVVYTWVDGNDPDWARRRDEALAETSSGELNRTATSASRFTTRDELLYSLRSLEMYASWVRRVHIVTAGQVPSWLDVDHPKIRVVDHAEIFADPSALPVFNSHAIESQLHHIPGLSDRYLYLNDDVFFGRPTRPELFFEGNGLTRFFVSAMLLDVDAPGPRDMPVLSAAKNNRALIERDFGRTVTNKFQHTPHPQSRVLLEEMEARYPEVFEAVARSTFRHPEDLSIASALHHYYGYATGRAVPSRVRYTYQDLAAVTSRRDLERIYDGKGHDVFCLNDTHMVPGPRADQAAAMLAEFLDAHFPLASSFEKDGSVR